MYFVIIKTPSLDMYIGLTHMHKYFCGPKCFVNNSKLISHQYILTPLSNFARSKECLLKNDDNVIRLDMT